MKLVINKAKRETVADWILGFAILGVIFILGFFIYLPILRLVEAGEFLSLSHLFRLDRMLFIPLPGLVFCVAAIWVSRLLKNEKTSVARFYDQSGPGMLLLVLFGCLLILNIIFANIFAALGF